MSRGLGNLWRRGRRGLLWFVLILVATDVSLNLWASLQLNRELGAIRQRGEPLTLAELIPTVPDAQNAAPVYQRANDTLPAPVQQIIGNGRAGRDTLTRQELATCRIAIALTRQAAAMPQCSFPRNLQDPLNDTFPHLSMLRQLMRLMRQQALQEAQEGQVGPALADTKVIFKISHHLAAEPNLIGWLTAVSVGSVGYRTLDEILPQAKLTRGQGRAVLAGLPDTDWSQALRHAMIGERAMGLWSFETLHHYPIWKLDEIQYLRFMQRTITYERQPSFVAQTTASSGNEIYATPAYALITRTLAPVYSGLLINRDKVEVLSQLAEVAVALDVYRTANGRYPARLQDAASAWGHPLPLDPYSHKTFIYRLEGAKFSLYSVGPNGKDDGGLNINSGDDIRLTPLRPSGPGQKRQTNAISQKRNSARRSCAIIRFIRCII